MGHFQRFAVGILVLPAIGAALSAGCANSSKFLLEQPRLSGPQRRLDLRSKQVHWTAEGAVYRVLAEIPLPGAGTGRSAYLLYLRVTADLDQQPDLPAPSEVRGFLIQTHGAHAGLTPVIKAAVTGTPPKGPGQSTWKLSVDLAFEDGSRVSGNLIATRADWKLRHFETRSHKADVQALLRGPPR